MPGRFEVKIGADQLALYFFLLGDIPIGADQMSRFSRSVSLKHGHGADRVYRPVRPDDPEFRIVVP